MYIVKEKIQYEVLDPETYSVIKTFTGYEKAKAEEFANLANSIAINEKSKLDTKQKELEKIKAELSELRSL